MMIDHSVIEKEAAFAEEMKGRALRAEKQLEELREAARALVSDLEDLDGEAITVCDSITGCDALALRGLCYGCNTRDLCDEHAQQFETGPEAERPLDAYDLSYAPALRRLRALLAG